MFRPRRFSRPRRLAPPPTFAGLFHPAATSRVRPPRISPDTQPYELVARRCPLAVHARPLPPVARRRRKRAPAYRALLRVPVRCLPWGFSPRPTRSLPELRLPRVLLCAPRKRLWSTLPPPTAFHGSRRLAGAQPDVLLPARLPRSRFSTCLPPHLAAKIPARPAFHQAIRFDRRRFSL
jgi:hypothetical protein